MDDILASYIGDYVTNHETQIPPLANKEISWFMSVSFVAQVTPRQRKGAASHPICNHLANVSPITFGMQVESETNSKMVLEKKRNKFSNCLGLLNVYNTLR